MGPRLIGRGNFERKTGIEAESIQASMGPRLIGRGNMQYARVVVSVDPAGFNGAAADWPRKSDICAINLHTQVYAASMGPRLIGRGNPGTVRPQRLL